MGHLETLTIECDCSYCEEQKYLGYLKEAGKFIAGFVATTIAVQLFVAAAPAILGATGFTAAGVRAGSMAAKVHSWIGLVKKGSWFASCMSMGARGALSPTAAASIRSIAQIFYASGASLSHMLKKDKDGNVIFPQNEHDLENLQNELIICGLLCRRCLKPIDPKKARLCRSICTGH